MKLDYIKIPFKGTHRLKSGTHETYCGIDVLKLNSFELCSNSKKICALCTAKKKEAANEIN